jgi:hypothetical protein
VIPAARHIMCTGYVREIGLSGLGESTPKAFTPRSRSHSAADSSSPGYWLVYSGVPPRRSTAPVRISRIIPRSIGTPPAASAASISAADTYSCGPLCETSTHVASP